MNRYFKGSSTTKKSLINTGLRYLGRRRGQVGRNYRISATVFFVLVLASARTNWKEAVVFCLWFYLVFPATTRLLQLVSGQVPIAILRKNGEGVLPYNSVLNAKAQAAESKNFRHKCAKIMHTPPSDKRQQQQFWEVGDCFKVCKERSPQFRAMSASKKGKSDSWVTIPRISLVRNKNVIA